MKLVFYTAIALKVIAYFIFTKKNNNGGIRYEISR